MLARASAAVFTASRSSSLWFIANECVVNDGATIVTDTSPMPPPPPPDRPLRHEQDFPRFAGEVIDITLKAPIGEAAAGQVSANRKKFRGTLERTEAGGWQIVWSDEPPTKPGQKISKKRVPAPLQALGFTLDELRDARLAPIVDFKGRGPKGGAAEG